MRDSIGATFMLKLALVFFVVYISIMSVALTYAKTYRIKNQIVNIVEQLEFTIDEHETAPATKEINNYLTKAYYNNTAHKEELEQKCKNSYVEKNGGGTAEKYKFFNEGVCIVEKNTSKEGSKYYKIVTFMVLDFAFFELEITIPVSGETKIIREI